MQKNRGLRLLLASFWLHFGSLWAHLETLQAPLGTTWATCSTQGWNWVVRPDHKSNLGSTLVPIWEPFFQLKLNILNKNRLLKTSPQSRASCVRFLFNFSDPGTLILELSPAREHDFQKITFVATSYQKAPKNYPKWMPKGSRMAPEGSKIAFHKAFKKGIQKESPTISLDAH